MSAWLIQHEATVKLAVMAVLLVVLALLQWRWPLRADARLPGRWLNNLGLIAVSSLLLRLAFPFGAAAFAGWMQADDIGLLNQFPLHPALSFPIAVVALDLAIYWQHRAFHRFALLWRVHRVHHSDTGFDVSLGLRFHPLEILPSMAYKLLVIAALGAPPLAALIYETLLLGFSLITHSDIALPRTFERGMRMVFITSDFHRVHHSVHRIETDSNYGNLLSIWDRLFGTLRPQPRDGHRQMVIGLPEFREPSEQTLVKMLRQPFIGTPASTRLEKENPHA